MLTNLKVLDLSHNQLNSTVLKFVGEILSLRSLYLSSTFMFGTTSDLNSKFNFMLDLLLPNNSPLRRRELVMELLVIGCEKKINFGIN